MSPAFASDKTACPICHQRLANLIRHFKKNRACAAALERKYPTILESGSVEDFLRGG